MSQKLHALQIKFQSYLQGGSDEIVKEIQGNTRDYSFVRLNIYKETYFLRLIEALTADFPVVHATMGEDLFQQLAKEYIVQHPPKEALLRWFGMDFPDFLTKTSCANKMFWAELAKFERALVNAFDERNCTIIMESALLAIPADQWFNLRFVLHPSLQLLSFQWNIATFWKGFYTQQKVPIKKYRRAQSWMIWRFELDNYFIRLAQPEAWALHQAANQTSFGTICEGLRVWIPQRHLILYATHFLKSWIRRGLIVKLLA